MAWTTRTIGLTAVGVAMIGGLAYVALRDDPVPVDMIVVAEAPMRVTIDADAKTRIRELYEVASPIAGTALRAPVEVGQVVAGGETIVARVEPATPSLLDARSRAQAEAAVAEARAALDVARTELTRAEEEAEFVETQFTRVQALVQRGVATTTRLEDATQQLTMARSAVAAARSRVIQAEGSVERSEAALLGPDGDTGREECCVDLVAPVDGVVLDIPTISEHPVAPGSPLVSIGDPADLEIVADILSSDAVRIGPGTRAIVERWGGPDPLQAVLRRIDPAAAKRVSALGIEEQRVDVIFDITSPEEARAGLPGPGRALERVPRRAAGQPPRVVTPGLGRVDGVASIGEAVDAVVGGRSVETSESSQTHYHRLINPKGPADYILCYAEHHDGQWYHKPQWHHKELERDRKRR